jgi:hypothetical protein
MNHLTTCEAILRAPVISGSPNDFDHAPTPNFFYGNARESRPTRPIRQSADSQQTLCWREVDSNFRFPAMVNLVVVAFVPRGCSGWIGAPQRGTAVQLDYHAR